MREEELRQIAKAKIEEENKAFAEWYNRVWGHLENESAISKATLDLIESAAKTGWYARSVR